MHLLSDTATWTTKAEFTDSNGIASTGIGESVIILHDDEITNRSWSELAGKRIHNNYRIIQSGTNRFDSTSMNPDLGIQKGTFDVDRNKLFSRFGIENTDMNGYEIIIREEDICYAYGALYTGKRLINTWSAVMTKVQPH